MLPHMTRDEITAKYGRNANLALAARGMGLNTHGVAEASALLVRFNYNVTVTDGVTRWNSNDSVPPLEIVALWESVGYPVDYAAASVARDADLKVVLANYRRNQPKQPTAEERVEARAAHGPGVELVDVLSGRRYTT